MPVALVPDADGAGYGPADDGGPPGRCNAEDRHCCPPVPLPNGPADPHRQPWRAFQRGCSLLITSVRPLRRTTVDPACRFNDLSELLTFIGASFCPTTERPEAG